MWNFKGNLWNSTQNTLPIHWNMSILFRCLNSSAPIFKSSQVFLNTPSLPALWRAKIWHGVIQDCTIKQQDFVPNVISKAWIIDYSMLYIVVQITYSCPAFLPWLLTAFNIDGLVQDCSISSASAMEILQSCTKPSIYNTSKYNLTLIPHYFLTSPLSNENTNHPTGYFETLPPT